MNFEECWPKDHVVKKLYYAAGSPKLAPAHRLYAKILADVLGDFKPDKGVFFLDHVPAIIADTVAEDSRLPKSERKLDFISDYMPSLTDLLPHESEEIVRSEAIRHLCIIFTHAFSEKYADFLCAYWNAQRLALLQETDKFKRLVWQKGLHSILGGKCLVGYFGKTEVSARLFIGRSSVAFSRGKNTLRKNVYLVGEEGRADKLRPGSAVDAPLHIALSMIEDVIAGWPEDPEAQKKIMKEVKS